jgi:two-component system, response regulator
MDIEKQFGTAVRKWRDKLQLSQEDLAKRAGLHRTYVCDVERGARNVSLKNIQKLADALAIPLLTFFSDLGVESTTPPRTADEQVDILVVEDSADDVALTLHAFKNWGVSNRMYVVNDGAAALDFLFGTGIFAHRRPTDQPQVILLDMDLPKIEGLEVLRRIKTDSRTRAIPVIILTSSKDARDITECTRLGVENYILKPVDFQSFSEVSLRLNLQWALLKSVVSSCQ